MYNIVMDITVNINVTLQSYENFISTMKLHKKEDCVFVILRK